MHAAAEAAQAGHAGETELPESAFALPVELPGTAPVAPGAGADQSVDASPQATPRTPGRECVSTADFRPKTRLSEPDRAAKGRTARADLPRGTHSHQNASKTGRKQHVVNNPG